MGIAEDPVVALVVELPAQAPTMVPSTVKALHVPMPAKQARLHLAVARSLCLCTAEFAQLLSVCVCNNGRLLEYSLAAPIKLLQVLCGSAAGKWIDENGS